jgi:hypothetical protein
MPLIAADLILCGLMPLDSPAPLLIGSRKSGKSIN